MDRYSIKLRKQSYVFFLSYYSFIQRIYFVTQQKDCSGKKNDFFLRIPNYSAKKFNIPNTEITDKHHLLIGTDSNINSSNSNCLPYILFVTIKDRVY